MMRVERGLEEPDPARRSALVIAAAYVAGGCPTTLIGGLTAGAAFGIARLIS